MGQISLAATIVQSKNFGLREQIMAISTSGSMSGKAISVYDPKPMAYKAVRVWLSDGSRILGMWTGTKWWSLQGEIKPVRWELEERNKKKTDSFAKLFRRSSPSWIRTKTRGQALAGPRCAISPI